MLTIPTTDIDPYSDQAIADPYPVYRVLRDLAPVSYLSAHSVFCAARYDEVTAALHQHDVYISGEGVGLTDTLNKAQKGSSFTSDPPYHAHVRGLVARHLKPRSLVEIHEYVDSGVPAGRCTRSARLAGGRGQGTAAGMGERRL
jgi:cytochrome P450